MSTQKLVVCTCNICSGKLEFDAPQAGTTIQCPHCQMDTVLFVPKVPLKTSPTPIPNSPSSPAVENVGGAPSAIWSCFSASKPKSKLGWLAVAALCVVIVGAPAQWLRNEYQLNKLLDEQLPKEETPIQRTRRLQAEAEFELLKRCTNEVTGLARVVDKFIFDSDSNPNKWTATVTAEYVNHFGGIDRTNLPFTFRQSDGHIMCSLDIVKLDRDELESFHRELERIRNRQ
jgi:DNA-directed RNA polymerase subunit RPC12/RpoP